MAPTKEDAHPSPHRHAIGLASLLYGLIAAPMAWIVSQIACSVLAQQACFPRTEPLADPAFSGVHAAAAGVMAGAIAVGASAAFVAFRNWRKTEHEPAGDPRSLLEVGEGRSRFMAFAGLLGSLGFVLATLFSIPAVLLVPAC